jgi:hypothetical protein
MFSPVEYSKCPLFTVRTFLRINEANAILCVARWKTEIKTAVCIKLQIVKVFCEWKFRL